MVPVFLGWFGLAGGCLVAVVGGLSECPAPAVFEAAVEAAVVFDEAVDVLDLQASAVPFFR